MNTAPAAADHPCFNSGSTGKSGRVHLPIAITCNIQCNYCNRKHDCVNESRPGVTSFILSPEQAAHYCERVIEMDPRISVVGIAGPGDPFASPIQTLQTLRLVRQRFPNILLCVASNGLNVLPYVDELADLRVSHVTLTINAVDPDIGARMYAWVRDGKKIYRKREAAGLMIERQLDALANLKARGILVKVNSIIVPGVNDHHIGTVAKLVSSLGADLFNSMPMYPTAGTPFEEVGEPPAEMIAKVRKETSEYLPQMLHCTRCRADAVGLLGADQSTELMSCLNECSSMPTKPADKRPYVAVASLEGALVNQHMGEAAFFRIYARNDAGCKMIDKREAPEKGGAFLRWQELADTLKDCRAVLVSAVGEAPRKVLEEQGIKVIVTSGVIEDCVDRVFRGGEFKPMSQKKACCSGGPSGPGGGC